MNNSKKENMIPITKNLKFFNFFFQREIDKVFTLKPMKVEFEITCNFPEILIKETEKAKFRLFLYWENLKVSFDIRILFSLVLILIMFV